MRGSSITGQRWGRLLILDDEGTYDILQISPNGRRQRIRCVLAECQCDKRTQKVIRKQSIIEGKTTSCGCVWREGAHLHHRKEYHEQVNSRTYHSWSNMIQRCRNRSNPNFSRYGENGIDVDPRWLEFGSFFADMGECPPGKTLDRVDNKRGYCKENCRWATRAEQAANRGSWAAKSVSGRRHFKGVHPVGNKWMALLGKKYLRLYGTEEEAARARDRAARESKLPYGLNFPDEK
jgi:hypothetical protein